MVSIISLQLGLNLTRARHLLMLSIQLHGFVATASGPCSLPFDASDTVFLVFSCLSIQNSSSIRHDNSFL
jgi:hypothetical protein